MYITRPRLSFLTNGIYIPKFKAKCFAPFMYNEDDYNYSNYKYSINKDTIFKNKQRSRDEMILSITSSKD